MRYRLADTVIELRTVREEVHGRMADYRTDEPAELRVATAWPDIQAEREMAENDRLSPVDYEMLAVHRRISDALLERDILLFHGSALSMDGQGYIFAAPSGTGKSTHARLWRERFGDRVTMVNDDKPFLKIGENQVTVYGSPWSGKHRLGTNTAVPLHAIALLERAEESSIERIASSDSVAALLQQSYREEDMLRIFPLVLKLAERVPVYRLRCNMKTEAAELAYREMSIEERK